MQFFKKIVRFEWDFGNKDKNWKKHRVANLEAEEVFFDPHKRIYQAKREQGEDRILLIGKTIDGRLLFVVFTIRQNLVRVISARDLNRRETKLYEKKD